MKALLGDLLTEIEKNEIEHVYPYVCLYVKDLSIDLLNNIGLIIIKHEYEGETPCCLIASEAINILYRRAKSKGLSFF